MTQTDQEYEEVRVKAMEAEGAPFVPEGTGKKRYTVTCKDGADWNHIHKVLMEDGTLEDNIPSDKCDCVNEYKTCGRIGTYLLDDAEVADLKNHSMVEGVNLDCEYYEGTFKGTCDRPAVLSYRYPANVKIGRDMGGFNSTFLPTTPGSDLLSRTGSSIYRHTQKQDPWYNQVPTNILQDRIQKHGDGTDVDLIVCDESAWHGHIEFIKTGVGEPSNFVGENVLKNGFSSSSTTGVCGVLDFALDTPYYIDPDFFEQDPTNRLTTRWDGTTVPVESWARSWWGTETTAYRSAKFVSNNISGGTAIVGSAEDFGTVFISSSYTRAAKNGSNTAEHTSGGYHGTPCMAQSYGKTHGWAYNSNKWHMNIIWSTGAISISNMFKLLKVFHQIKPNRSSDNTKNPTITSHSWGRSRNLTDSTYYFRTPGDGTGGVSYTTSTRPQFLNHFYVTYRHSAHSDASHSESVLGKDMIDAGVIFVAASGNDHMKQVLDGHADYDNYDGGSNTTLAAAMTGDAYGRTMMTNRIAFPADIGKFVDGGVDVQPTFNIGALDDAKVSIIQERKAAYSNMGNAIDLYTHGADSLSATDGNTTSSGRDDRYDEYYRIDSNYNVVSGGTSTYNISVTAPNSSYYTLNGLDSNGSINGNNETINCAVGDLINFNVNVSGHPFWIKTSASTGTGSGASGVSNNGSESGTVSFTPSTAGTYYYICQYHGSMVGIINVASGGTQSYKSEDRPFGGTSSACPVACGLIATMLQYNRTWEWRDIKSWLVNSVDNQSTSLFYRGTEATTADSSQWSDDFNLQGHVGKILYQALPAYTITPSASTVNEGDTVTTTITTENVLDSVVLYWNITGTNIDSADFSVGALAGSGTISSNTFSLTHTLDNDVTTEGSEVFNINLFTDAARTKQVATTAITVNDTSTTPAAETYSISPSPLTVNEGNTVITTVTTTNVADNTTLWWSLSGMNQADFSSGALTGFGIITSNTFSFNHTLALDQITEGTEYVNYELWTDSGRTARVGIATVTVLDTSQAEPVFVPVTLKGSGVTLSGVTVNIK